LDIVQKIWAPLRKLFATPSVLNWLRALVRLQRHFSLLTACYRLEMSTARCGFGKFCRVPAVPRDFYMCQAAPAPRGRSCNGESLQNEET